MLNHPLDTLTKDTFHTMTYVKGDLVFRQGEATRGMFFVQRGQINLRRFTQAGHVVTVHHATQGTLFAEASLYSDHYHCDAHCITGSTVIGIDKVTVLSRMAQDLEFTTAFNKLLATQIQTYRLTMEILAIKSAKERTLAAVAAGYLTGPVTEFASHIGLTHEACYRALRTLSNEGSLDQVSRGKYIIKQSTTQS